MNACQVLMLLLQSLDERGQPVPCRGTQAQMWTSEDAIDRRAARIRCKAECSALAQCSAYAEHMRPTHGVWAGTDYSTPTNRRKVTTS